MAQADKPQVYEYKERCPTCNAPALHACGHYRRARFAGRLQFKVPAQQQGGTRGMEVK